MRTLFSILFCLLMAAPLVNAGPPNPTESDPGGNTAGGTGALINAAFDDLEDTDNTAFGFNALFSNIFARYNTASGAYALYSNTGGFYNTASGFFALAVNTRGTGNTASGSQALRSNNTGSYNMASGHQTLFYNTTGFRNTASGVYALRANTTGTYNTANGTSALYANATGTYNTASGYRTLVALTSGHRNTALGWGAGSLLTSGSNNIYLGHPGVASESSTLRLGDVQTRAFIKGVVGVPISGLHVTINAAGQLGVAPSSERYKQNIEPLAAQESKKVHQLKPVTFHYKTEPTGALQYGLIAEEVAKVYPELITWNENGVIEGIRYEALTPLLLKEVQGQHQQIATQAQQLTVQAQQLTTQAQQMQMVLQQQAAQAQQLAELKLQNDSLRAAVAQLQGPATVAMTTASRLQ